MSYIDEHYPHPATPEEAAAAPDNAEWQGCNFVKDHAGDPAIIQKYCHELFDPNISGKSNFMARDIITEITNHFNLDDVRPDLYAIVRPEWEKACGGQGGYPPGPSPAPGANAIETPSSPKPKPKPPEADIPAFGGPCGIYPPGSAPPGSCMP